MLCALSFLSIAAFAYDFQSAILVSRYTPSSWLSDFESLSRDSYKIQIFQVSNSTLPTSQLQYTNLIFDFTESLSYQSLLRDFALSREILYFSNRQDSFPFFSKMEFYLHPPPLVEASALQVLLNYFNLTDYHLLTSPSSASKAISSFLSSSPPEVFSNDISQEVFDRYTGRVIKSSGNWKTVFTGEERGASKVLQAFENTRIFKERSVVVLTSKAIKAAGQMWKAGTIGIAEEGLEEAQTQAELEFKAVLRVLKILDKLMGGSEAVVSNEMIARRLDEYSPDHIVSSRYSIVNMKNTLQIVGSIEDSAIKVTGDIMFPGNVSQINNSPPEILISANTGPIEWDGTVRFIAVSLSLGLQPMVDIVNNDSSILPTFSLRLHETDCGYNDFNYEYTSKCMERHKDKLGVAHLTSQTMLAIESYLNLFKEYGVRIPNIANFVQNTTAYDKTLYPEFLITTPDYVYFYIILPYMIRSFGWDRVILIYNKNIDPLYHYAFAYHAGITEIEIVNPPELMYVPLIKTKSYNNEVKPILEYIKKSKCRIIVLLADPGAHIYFIESLYDFGYRRGELVIIYLSKLSAIIELYENLNFDKDKVLEITDGSLAMNFPHYVEEYGEQLEKQIASMIYPESNDLTCYRIDSLMLAVRTIDLMIQAGADFEDFDRIMFFMRGIRFTGCSGKISIDSSGNGLRDIVYYFYNFYVTEEGWKETQIGSYSVGVMVPLKMEKKIVWPNGATETPSDTIEDPECGFPESLVSTNKDSRKISIILTTVPIGCVLIVASCVYICFRRIEREYLKEKRDMFFEDGVFLYLPILEAVQIIGLGPGFYTVNPYLSFVSSVSIFELESVLEFEFDFFWLGIYIGSLVCFVWSVCLILSSFDLEKKLPTAVLKDFVEVVGFTFIPLFSRVLFVPLNVLLLNIYDCKKGVGEESTQSFLDKDCKTWCWEDKQLLFAIEITAVLTIYNILAIVSTIFYDEVKEYVSVKTHILYAFLKPAFVLILISLRFNLKEEFEGAFCVSHCCCIILWTMFTLKIDPHNYKRLNMWIRVVLGSVCFHQILVAIYRMWNIPGLVLVISEIFLVLGSIALGLILQFKYFPSMLTKKKGRNFDKLLKFTFTKRLKAYELTEHQLDYRDHVIKMD